jgi:hypothetical protein
MDMTTLVVLGVFAGLIALIVILKAVRKRQESLLDNEAEAVESASKPAISNRAELVAVAASCIAEVMGKDVSGLRIISINQVN